MIYDIVIVGAGPVGLFLACELRLADISVLVLEQNGRGLLLDFDAFPSLQTLASRWSSQVTYVASDAKDRLGLSSVLVRPDGFVAWALMIFLTMKKLLKPRRDGSANPKRRESA